MQGMVNKLADLQGAFSGMESMNRVIKTKGIYESLACGYNSTKQETQENGCCVDQFFVHALHNMDDNTHVL